MGRGRLNAWTNLPGPAGSGGKDNRMLRLLRFASGIILISAVLSWGFVGEVGAASQSSANGFATSTSTSTSTTTTSTTTSTPSTTTTTVPSSTTTVPSSTTSTS